MSISKKQYQKMVKKASIKSPKIKDFSLAFLVGGFICVVGQLLLEWFKTMPFSEEQAKIAVPVTLIFIASVLTGFGIFDKIAKHAGAGTLVPITGFSNAVTAPAIEFKAEGQILGMGVKMFTIAGPVLVYGITASVIYGIILYIIEACL